MFMFESWAGGMAQWVKMLTSKPDNLHLIPRNHRTDAHKLFSNFHVLNVAVHPSTLAHTHTYTHTHTHTHQST